MLEWYGTDVYYIDIREWKSERKEAEDNITIEKNNLDKKCEGKKINKRLKNT